MGSNLAITSDVHDRWRRLHSKVSHAFSHCIILWKVVPLLIISLTLKCEGLNCIATKGSHWSVQCERVYDRGDTLIVAFEGWCRWSLGCVMKRKPVLWWNPHWRCSSVMRIIKAWRRIRVPLDSRVHKYLFTSRTEQFCSVWSRATS